MSNDKYWNPECTPDPGRENILEAVDQILANSQIRQEGLRLLVGPEKYARIKLGIEPDPLEPNQPLTTKRKELNQPLRYDSIAEWHKEAAKRFGDDMNDWKFQCPCCETETTVKEWRDAGVPDQAAFSCIGRSQESPRQALDKGPGPCNYAGGGLFRLNPITIADGEEEHQAFAFAEVEA